MMTRKIIKPFMVLALLSAMVISVARADEPVCVDDSCGVSVYEAKKLEKKPERKAETKGVVAKALAGPMASMKELIFAIRARGPGHFYETYGYDYYDPSNSKASHGGGKLCRLNVHTGELKIILEDDGGAMRDPCVSFDGKRVVFAWRKTGSNVFHIYEMNVDGSGLRQLTNDTFNDVEPIYLSGGDIVFVSDRAGRGVPCWRTQVGLLHRCDPDGNDIRLLSNGIEHEIKPWLLNDGRLVYCRWEYVNRSATAFHHLWSMNPDGTGSMTYYGNMHPGFAITEARPIPGTDKISCIFGPGHGVNERRGYFAVVSVNRGPDDKHSAKMVSTATPLKKGSLAVWRDPHPVSENCFLLCSEDNLYVMNGNGDFETLFSIPKAMKEKMKETIGRWDLWVHEPMPLQAWDAPPAIAPRVNYKKDSGVLVLQDVTMGRKLNKVHAQQIKKLLVMEALPMPLSLNWRRDTAFPIGTGYNLKRILGTIPVEKDGSAHVELPAMRNLFFVAVDERGRQVKRMNSFVNLMPGEVTSCVGCHERRTRAPHGMPDQTLMALQREPSKPVQIDGVPESGIFDYPRDIQPILDRNCAKCHNPDKMKGEMILSAELGTGFHHSVRFLARRGILRGDQIMRFFHGHHGVKPKPEELATVKAWLYTLAQYSGTYGSFGAATDGSGFPWAHPGKKEQRQNGANVSIDWSILERRCDQCHIKGKRKYQGHYSSRTWPLHPNQSEYYNLLRPDKSLLLLAPLSKEAGGLGLCRNRKAASTKRKDARGKLTTEGEPATVFADTSDSDYIKLLASLQDLGRQYKEKRVFPIPKWQPLGDYIREMKHYGALPEDFDAAKGTVDPFALDETYYHLYYPGGAKFRYKPAPPEQASSE